MQWARAQANLGPCTDMGDLDGVLTPSVSLAQSQLLQAFEQ